MRTIVEIPDAQLSELTKLCLDQKISRAEAVRRAVDRMLQESARTKTDVGFGIWKKKKLNARKFVDDRRAEWGDR